MKTRKATTNPASPRNMRLRNSSRCSPMVMRYSSGSCLVDLGGAAPVGAEDIILHPMQSDRRKHRAHYARFHQMFFHSSAGTKRERWNRLLVATAKSVG